MTSQDKANEIALIALELQHSPVLSRAAACILCLGAGIARMSPNGGKR